MNHLSSEPPVIGVPPPIIAGSFTPVPAQKPTLGRQLLAILLSLCLGLFLVDAGLSLLDDTLRLLFDLHFLSILRGMVGLFAVLIAIVVYGLMALTPMIPKRLFIPVTLFNLMALLVALPLMIFFDSRMQQIAWVISFGQVILGLWVLHRVQGGFTFHWPPVAANRLEPRRFSWLNLAVFVLGNVFVLLPAVVVYLAICAAVAVNHFSEGFVTLRPSGLMVQVRNYVRKDGKTIRLIPMAHIGDRAFYRTLSQSFPTNSTILMEGVTDEQNLLTNKITYKRMATSLGLTEQVKAFKPRGHLVRADVDVEEFSTNTINFLNVIMLVHSKGLNSDTIRTLVQYSPPPQYEEKLWDDLLRKRNRHLLAEIRTRLPDSQILIVPWGAAHMPELAREIQKSGFRLGETREYTVIRFGPAGRTSRVAQTRDEPGKPK
jgi:hypothetical protein